MPGRPRGWRAKVRDWTYRPRLDTVQVEINSVCRNACTYCPNAVFRRGGRWRAETMPLELFRCILPELARALESGRGYHPLLYLQGWGEPLLHPDFFAMLAMAKRRRCTVGITSCGDGIDLDAAHRLVEGGLDHLAISMAGTGEANDRARVGTRISDLYAAIDAVAMAKRRTGAPRPALNIAYMLLRSGLAEAETIPEALAGRGIDTVVISTLTYPPSPALREEAIFPEDQEEYEAMTARLGAISARGRERGLSIVFHVPAPRPWRGLCLERAQHRSIVVRPDGRLTSCMLSRFTPASEPAPAPEQFVFGDLTRESLAEIWWKPEYVDFRRSFWDGCPPARCLECPRLGMQ